VKGWNGWTISKTEHGLACHECMTNAAHAKVEAIVTGSIGATHTTTSLNIQGEEISKHSATVRRDQ
jgi:hypothetical protein